MLNKANRPVQEENNIAGSDYTFSDEATKRKIRRHIKDINDVITEKDIKNAKVPGAEDETPEAPKRTRKPRKSSKNIADETTGNPITPWDTIDE